MVRCYRVSDRHTTENCLHFEINHRGCLGASRDGRRAGHPPRGDRSQVSGPVERAAQARAGNARGFYMRVIGRAGRAGIDWDESGFTTRVLGRESAQQLGGLLPLLSLRHELRNTVGGSFSSTFRSE